MKVTVNNEALAAILGIKAGNNIDVKCKNGVPVNKEWRNRFKDTAIDNCISIPNKSKPKTKPKPVPKPKALAIHEGE